MFAGLVLTVAIYIGTSVTPQYGVVRDRPKDEWLEFNPLPVRTLD